MSELDFDSVEEIDDCDDEQLHVLIFNTSTGNYEWHWVYREALFDHDMYELARYGLVEAE